MKKDNFDEILVDVLKEYVKDTELNSVDVPEVKFSERHKRNMEEIFAAVENGTLGNFKQDKENELSKKNNFSNLKSKKHYFYRFSKVAIWILLGLVALLVAAPSMTAWRSEDSEFYGEDKNEYAWLLRNDTTEILESNVENSETYLEIFVYLPEGFELKRASETDLRMYIQLENFENQKLELKVTKNINKAVDYENTDYQNLTINDMKISYAKRNNMNIFTWNFENNEYYLLSDVEYEILYKVIENIKYKI